MHIIIYKLLYIYANIFYAILESRNNELKKKKITDNFTGEGFLFFFWFTEIEENFENTLICNVQCPTDKEATSEIGRRV